MVQDRTTGRLVESVRDNTEVFYDILRRGNERVYRMNRMIVDEAQRTQDESMDLLRQWLQSPTDIAAFNNELFGTWTRRLRRRMELARTFADDLRDFGAGTRNVWERVTDNGRQSARATAQAGREIGASVVREASDVAADVSDAVNGAARTLRREAREAEDNLN